MMLGTKGRLRKITELMVRYEGITRGDLIEAAELAYLYNRDYMAEWVKQIQAWKMTAMQKPERTAGIGTLRQALERRYGMNQAESLSVIQSVPESMLTGMIDTVWKDGTGRNNVPWCADIIYSYYKYNGGRGDDCDSEGNDYTYC